MTYIDELRPEMEKKQEEKRKQKESKYTEKEKYWREHYFRIKNLVKEYVKKSMLEGNPPSDIKHYYYYEPAGYCYDYIPPEESLEEIAYFAYPNPDNEDLEILNALKEKLEDFIVNKIGYKYCEVVIEDKIHKADVEYKSIFGSKKGKVVSSPAKAIWIHASMEKSGFSSVKSRGSKVQYNGHYSAKYDSGRFGREKYKAWKESQKHS